MKLTLQETLILSTLSIGLLASDPPRPLVVKGGTIIDVSNFGKSESDIKDSVVVILGDEIIAAGPREKIEVPVNARVINAEGKYIVPGLNDVFSAQGNQAQANAHLYMGVTSIVGIDTPARKGARRPPLYVSAKPSPRIYKIDAISGYADEKRSLEESELIDQVNSLARAGVNVLLLHYGLSPAQTKVVAREARKLGVATIGELGATRYPEAIRAGVNAFVHTSRYSLELAPPALRAQVALAPFGPPKLKYYEFLARLRPEDPALKRYASVLGSSNSGLIPTLSLIYLDLPDHDNPWKEPIAAILDPKDIHLPANPLTGRRDSAPEGPADSFPAGLAQNILMIEEQYRKAGARYLAGSGTTAFGTLPGISLHIELKLLCRIGLTPRQAIAAATSNVGEIFGWKKIGQVKAGYHADLLVLDENPVTNIENLKKIRTVILQGEILDREKLLTKQ
jgi:hypothetical protein